MALIDKINEVLTTGDRGGFTQGLRDQTYYMLPNGICYNIMVRSDPESPALTSP